MTAAAVRATTGLTASATAWGQARDLAELGELTAQWLTGKLACWPGYGLDEAIYSDLEDPALAEPLATLNRAGFVTIGSQPGEEGIGYDGAWWQQRAAVEGFAHPALAARIRDALAGNPQLAVLTHTQPRSRRQRRQPEAHPMLVTLRAGYPYTGFGGWMSRREIAFTYDGCRPEAVDAVCAAWQLTVVDLVWGRPDLLWHALTEAGGVP